MLVKRAFSSEMVGSSSVSGAVVILECSIPYGVFCTTVGLKTKRSRVLPPKNTGTNLTCGGKYGAAPTLGKEHLDSRGPNSALLGAVRLGIAHRADWPRHIPRPSLEDKT